MLAKAGLHWFLPKQTASALLLFRSRSVRTEVAAVLAWKVLVGRGSSSCQWTPSPSHLCPLEAWSDEPSVFPLWPTGSFPRPGILVKGIKRQRESGLLRSSDLRMETGSSNMSSEMREPLRTVVFHEFLSFPCCDKAVAI